MEYCVAIRTLGKAGEKFQRELNSIIAQTIKPKKILVYLAEGFPIPPETVGVEQYIYVKKGMQAQRALDYNEVDTPLCLMLDDDVELHPESVETMIADLIENNADCIAADTFENHKMSLKNKLLAAVTNWVFPHFNKRFGFKINVVGTFSFPNNPSNGAFPSQSGAGPCSLWKIDAFKRIHFEDEGWLDDERGFAFSEDMLLFHKLYRNGGKLMVSFGCGAKHLDAKSSSGNYRQDVSKFRKRIYYRYIIWRRIWIDAADISAGKKFFIRLAYLIKSCWDFGIFLLLSIATFSLNPLKGFFSGWRQARRFVKSPEYKSIPNYIIQKKNINE